MLMTEVQIDQLKRQRLTELKSRLLAQEKALADERHHLWLREKNHSSEYQVWERLECLTTDILGYLTQIVSKGFTRQSPEMAIAHLYQLSIFETDCIANWYLSEADNYPKIKQYFELLDYVRLLILQDVSQAQ